MMFLPVWFDVTMTFVMLVMLLAIIPYNNVPKITSYITFIVGIIAVFLLGCAPAIEDVGTDRPVYAYMFSHADELLRNSFRDPGFSVFVKFCQLLSDSPLGGFLISALIYVCANIYFYAKSSPHRYIFMLLLCFLSLGFTNHHYNVLRSGLCISFLLIALSKDQKNIIRILFSILAVSFHVSGLLVIIGFLLTSRIRNTKLFYFFWGVIFVALLAGSFDSFEQYVGLFSSEDGSRIDRYIAGNDRGYKTGLRLDFIAYSFFPIIVGAYYIFMRYFKDEYYIHLYNTYLFCNACWLSISKMPSNDRLAYLSWVFIPFLLLYPILYDTKQMNVGFIPYKKTFMVVLISVITGLNLFLKYI